MLNNVEKLEKVVYSGGNFSVKNMVLLGQKTQIGNRLDPVYEREYNSTKYNNLNTLKSIRFTQNEYLAFCYNDFDKKINEEVLISYPHMNSLLNFFEDVCGLVNANDTFTNNSVAVKYKDVIVESDDFVQGKRMIAMPAVWESNNDNRKLRKGVFLFINSEENCVQLDINAINSLTYILQTFNLSIASSNLLIMGMLTEVGRGVPQSAPQNNFRTNDNMKNKPANRGLFSNSNGNRRNTFNNSNNEQRTNRPLRQSVNEMKNEEVNSNGVVDEDIDDTPHEKPAKKKLSMQNIMDTASEIDVDDIDDVEI